MYECVWTGIYRNNWNISQNSTVGGEQLLGVFEPEYMKQDLKNVTELKQLMVINFACVQHGVEEEALETCHSTETPTVISYWVCFSSSGFEKHLKQVTQLKHCMFINDCMYLIWSEWRKHLKHVTSLKHWLRIRTMFELEWTQRLQNHFIVLNTSTRWGKTTEFVWHMNGWRSSWHYVTAVKQDGYKWWVYWR